jgi:RNA polymerase sigma-70 factor (ECF subfamily)
VAANKALNALRARKRRQGYEGQAAVLALESEAPGDPEAVVEQIQERQRVRAALGVIKPRAAQILILRHSGMTYAEIAAALQISPASVGTLLARAEMEFERAYHKVQV